MTNLKVRGCNDVEINDASMLFVSRHLERIGDHAKNIAEATIYAATGEMNQFDELEDRNFEELELHYE